MICIILNSRTGNQLFQFAFGVILGKELNTKVFYLVSEHEFKFLDFFHLSWKIKLLKFKLFREFINWFSYRIEKLEIKKIQSCLDKMEVDHSLDNSILNGYFQDGTLLERNQLILKSRIEIKRKYVLAFENTVGIDFFKKKSLVIHIRRGDYKEAYFSEIASTALLPFDWFNKVMKQIPSDAYDLLYVVSDDIKEVEEEIDWDGYNPIFFNGSVSDDFQLIMNADIAIISNSSFAWWAAFLNPIANKKIFAPKNWVGYHVNIEYPKGIMIDQFTWVD